MSLRFTDTNKWRDPWYMDLPVLLKVLWLYVCDSCDNAGVWVVNTKLAEFEIGTAIDWADALTRYHARVRAFADGGKWHLIKFVAFQNPRGLSASSHPHQQILRLLATHGLKSPSTVSSNPSDRVGFTLPVGSEGDSKTRPDQPSPVRGGCKGGINTALLLAEFGIPTAAVALAEWKSGLAKIAKCRSAEEARAFLVWAIDTCAKADLRVAYWRHVALLAQEWDAGARTTHWKAA